MYNFVLVRKTQYVERKKLYYTCKQHI